MDISLLNILRTVSWDFRRDMAQSYANGLKKAIEVHLDNDVEKEQGYFLSKKGIISKDPKKSIAGNFQDKLYVGNIHSIENHLYWNDEELADDDQVINVVTINGPVTRDGGACSYGTKDWRDQILYADTIPQVVGHLFIVNSPGGESACRNDYDIMMEDWRAHKKPAVMYVDGMACSSLIGLGCRCDRIVVRNPKDDIGCIGSMAAFWATPDGAKDVDGSRFIEIVGDNAPEKNDWYRNAAEGDYEKLRALINKDTNEFHQTVRDNRPLVEDWMLSGNVFEAQEVMPALVDEIGTLDRAIECVFELADGRLTPAREAKKAEPAPANDEPKEEPKVEPDPQKEPEPDPNKQPAPEGPEDEPEIGNTANKKGEDEMSKLNEQQKTAMSTRKGTTKIVNNGHVKEVQETMFGPVETEIAKPQHNNNMEEEKKKTQEAAQAQVNQEHAPAASAEEQPKAENPDEKPAEDPNKKGEEPDGNKPAEDPKEKNPEENPNEDPNGVNPEENPGGEDPNEKPEDPEDPNDDPNENPEDPNEDPEDDPKKKKDDDPDDKCGGEDPKKGDNANDALRNAESLVAERDKTIKAKDSKIAELQKQLEEKSKDNSKNLVAIADRDKNIKALTETVAELKKQVSELRGEVKELSAEPTPMANDEAGVPKDNGTGAVMTGAVKSIVTSDMSADEIRERLRKQDKEMAEKRRRR